MGRGREGEGRGHYRQQLWLPQEALPPTAHHHFATSHVGSRACTHAPALCTAGERQGWQEGSPVAAVEEWRLLAVASSTRSRAAFISCGWSLFGDEDAKFEVRERGAEILTRSLHTLTPPRVRFPPATPGGNCLPSPARAPSSPASQDFCASTCWQRHEEAERLMATGRILEESAGPLY